MMPVLQPQLEKVTLEQYEMLPEEKRFEVFDGVIYDMASPSQVHQALSMQLSTLINTYILRKKSYIFLTLPETAHRSHLPLQAPGKFSPPPLVLRLISA